MSFNMSQTQNTDGKLKNNLRCFYMVQFQLVDTLSDMIHLIFIFTFSHLRSVCQVVILILVIFFFFVFVNTFNLSIWW